MGDVAGERRLALFEVIPFKEELRRARPLHVVKAFVPPEEGKTDRAGHPVPLRL
jgi:hypothetical protein